MMVKLFYANIAISTMSLIFMHNDFTNVTTFLRILLSSICIFNLMFNLPYKCKLDNYCNKIKNNHINF